MKHFMNGLQPKGVSRRDFVRVSLVLGGGLMISVVGCGPNGEEPADAKPGDETLAPNAFVRIDPQGRVTVISKHLEMGQGAYTGLATIIAEELDADWSTVSVIGAGADDKLFGNATMGGLQGTGDTRSPLFISLISQFALPIGMLTALQATRPLVPRDIWLAIVLGGGYLSRALHPWVGVVFALAARAGIARRLRHSRGY
jgi:isoquinoline 1-oxidoreductase beta subunit